MNETDYKDYLTTLSFIDLARLYSFLLTKDTHPRTGSVRKEIYSRFPNLNKEIKKYRMSEFKNEGIILGNSIDNVLKKILLPISFALIFTVFTLIAILQTKDLKILLIVTIPILFFSLPLSWMGKFKNKLLRINVSDNSLQYLEPEAGICFKLNDILFIETNVAFNIYWDKLGLTTTKIHLINDIIIYVPNTVNDFSVLNSFFSERIPDRIISASAM